jgi:hypothetical protein
VKAGASESTATATADSTATNELVNWGQANWGQTCIIWRIGVRPALFANLGSDLRYLRIGSERASCSRIPCETNHAGLTPIRQIMQV